MIPLTLRAMHRTRHPRARSSARPAVALLSVLAVLAMALFPSLALAEESSGIQYETEVPTVPTHQSSNIPSNNKGGKSKSGHEPTAEASGNSPSGGGTGGGHNGSNTGGGATTGQGNQGSGGSGGHQQNGSNAAGGNLAKAKPLNASEAPAESSGGGSSPLVPILIAVAVLAAISVGAYLYRQRRGGSGSAVSPKAS
jgi:cobalamin biosynthesis Mg chelatase CobN